MRLEGKNALITGGSSGIGRAIALAFGNEGANVAVNYRKSVDEANEVVAALQKLGRKSVALQADVGTVADVQGIVGKTVEAFGRIDILVCSAGLEIREPFLEVSEQHYDTVLNVNLKGTYFACQAAAQQMVKQGGSGRIVNISSIHEDIAFLHYSTYCASKGGVRMLTRQVSQELAPHGITINNIAPGAVETPINTRTLTDPTLLDALKEVIPMGRLAKPEEVAAVAVFLASDESSYVTGCTYYVDGGMSRWNKGL
jgi:glucose 1-dehydrogenase